MFELFLKTPFKKSTRIEMNSFWYQYIFFIIFFLLFFFVALLVRFALAFENCLQHLVRSARLLTIEQQNKVENKKV